MFKVHWFVYSYNNIQLYAMYINIYILWNFNEIKKMKNKTYHMDDDKIIFKIFIMF